MAFAAASLICWGTWKWGWPIEKLIGFLSCLASSNTFRMPEASILRARSEISFEESNIDGASCCMVGYYG